MGMFMLYECSFYSMSVDVVVKTCTLHIPMSVSVMMFASSFEHRQEFPQTAQLV